ncbi:tyrosine-type recombinase/integrase [Thiocapsa sp. UBA6158]|uniref:tyrosine-type recombinase/integrase n=1 Tax=Thiocapsa sp. UBA6158 TaxID=1947692 RepID=UPI0025FF16E4|nr:integrase family protein [Thiocapsa sp. UBA6158]
MAAATILTAYKVETLRYKAGGPTIQRLWDAQARGLGLEVFPSGRKSWVFRYSFEGKQRIKTLAPFADATLEEARADVVRHRETLKTGRDPFALSVSGNPTTVAQLWERYSKTAYYLSRSDDFQNNMKSAAKVYWLPLWGSRPLASLTRGDVRECINALLSQGKEGAARGLLNRTRILFNYALEEEWVESSPADHIKPRYTTSGRRDAWLETDAELLAAFNLNAPVQVRLMVRWMLLTGCRRDEARLMTWDAVADGVWRVPKTKNGHALTLPILPAMQAVLDESRATFGTTPFVFPSTTTNRKEIPRASFDYSVRVATWDSDTGKAAWSAHVLRHTVESHLKELGVGEEQRDMVLNHVRASSGERYGHGQALALKRDALAPWHAKLATLRPELHAVEAAAAAAA